MDTNPDLTLQLSRDAFYQVIHTLRDTLRPVSDSPDDLTRRDNAAIAQVACLLPADADEANLAAQYVAANAQAMECMRLAREYYADPTLILQCTAQAARMMREARAARSLLMRVQAARQKREADADAAQKAAQAEHCAAGLMAQALGRAQPAPKPGPLPDNQPLPPATPDFGLPHRAPVQPRATGRPPGHPTSDALTAEARAA